MLSAPDGTSPPPVLVTMLGEDRRQVFIVRLATKWRVIAMEDPQPHLA